jgi:hypothetical protein
VGGVIVKKKLIAVAIFMSVLIVVSAFSGTASAGVEPSPFKSTLGNLGSIDNNLIGIHRNLRLVLANPPLDDQVPGWKGPSYRLEALGEHLDLLDSRLEESLGASRESPRILELFEYLEENLLFRLNEMDTEFLDFLRVHSIHLTRMPEAYIESLFNAFELIHSMQDRIFEFMTLPIPPIDK